MTGLAGRIRDAVLDVDSSSSLAGRARARRWQDLIQIFPNLGSMQVIDLGGTAASWERAPIHPRSVTLLNPSHQTQRSDWLVTVAGDACSPPDHINASKFDLVYSNSALEHVGGPWRRQRFAEVARRLARHHWIQTPARSFPLEPHWLFPGFQFLPVRTRAWISRHWPLGQIRSEDRDGSVHDVLGVELLSRLELEALFPDADVIAERVYGVTKSIIAVR